MKNLDSFDSINSAAIFKSFYGIATTNRFMLAKAYLKIRDEEIQTVFNCIIKYYTAPTYLSI